MEGQTGRKQINLGECVRKVLPGKELTHQFFAKQPSIGQ